MKYNLVTREVTQLWRHHVICQVNSCVLIRVSL